MTTFAEEAMLTDSVSDGFVVCIRFFCDISVSSMRAFYPCAGLSPDSWCSRCRRFLHHRPNDQFIAFFQFAFQQPGDFRVRMIGDPESYLPRFHGVIAVELPDHGRIPSRRARLILCSSTALP